MSKINIYFSLHPAGLYECHIGMGYTKQNNDNEIMIEGNDDIAL